VTTPKSGAQNAPEAQDPQICPYCHQVVADFASLYPAGSYCAGGSDKRVKVMAQKTVDEICAKHFTECEGYQRLRAEEEARAKATPDSLRR